MIRETQSTLAVALFGASKRELPPERHCTPRAVLSLHRAVSIEPVLFGRRAAHFAHYQVDDEEEADNAHVGGTEACLLLL